MPYILQSQRSLEFFGSENQLNIAAEIIRGVTDHTLKAQDCRDFLSYLIDGVYGEPCFNHSRQMTDMVRPALLACANLLVANIAAIHGAEGGREGLLNYTLTRFFNEAYPSARYKDYNSIAGILSSMLRLAHPGNIELLGMLACCRDEYYRKYAAPYEDKKESENGAVERPNAPPSSAY